MPFARYFCIFINAGLGEGSALPVGVPVPWPSATPPTGWLKCNGAAFSAEEYPELAKAYPTNKLPDLRGEFIRGWDDGRGVDSGQRLARRWLGATPGTPRRSSHMRHSWLNFIFRGYKKTMGRAVRKTSGHRDLTRPSPQVVENYYHLSRSRAVFAL